MLLDLKMDPKCLQEGGFLSGRKPFFANLYSRIQNGGRCAKVEPCLDANIAQLLEPKATIAGPVSLVATVRARFSHNDQESEYPLLIKLLNSETPSS